MADNQIKNTNNWVDRPWNNSPPVGSASSLYLHPQRKMLHKVRIFYEEFRDLSINQDASGSAVSTDKVIFDAPTPTVPEEQDRLPDIEHLNEINSPNDNNVTNFNQLFSSENFRVNTNNVLILDGNTPLDRSPKLLSKNAHSMTEQPVGWMSRELCDTDGRFEVPVRLVYTFENEQSIARWLIRAHRGEAPFDFSVCVYNSEDRLIFKHVQTNNTDSEYAIDVNRGLCKKIELRITRWHAHGRFAATNAKILYFYHNALFPEGPTDYYSHDLLQSFSVSENAASSIGKANYGVQSDTGQFSLVNIDRYFHILKFADFIKAGLKVQFFVKAEDILYDEEECPDCTATSQCNTCKDRQAVEDAIVASETPPPIPRDVSADDGWELLATHYICDIDFDEVKHTVKFKTQDRLQEFTNHKYGGLKTVILEGNRARLAPVGSRQIFDDILSKAELRSKTEIVADNASLSDNGDSEDNPTTLPEGVTLGDTIQNNRLFERVNNSGNRMQASIDKGLINDMSIWAALQKACNVDLLHIYVSRDDVLVIDKINQF